MLDEHFHELVVQLARHVEALGRGAHLPGVQVGGPGAALGRHLHLAGHVGADDERVLAAHLEVHPRHALGARRRHALAGGHRAGERHAVHARVANDRLAHVAGAGDRVERSRRQVLEAGREHQGGERRELRRLGHHRVARGERRRHLPGEQQQRVVPGHDAAPHADRLLQHERELSRLDRGDHPTGEVAAHLGVVVERRGGPADLVAVLEQRLPALERHHPRDLLGTGAQAFATSWSSSARSTRRGGAPARGGLRRGRDRRVHLLRSGGVEAGERLLGGRILDRERRPRRPRPARRRSEVGSPRGATLPAAAALIRARRRSPSSSCPGSGR